MTYDFAALDLEGLLRMERACREQLYVYPEDASLRINMARCLLLRAMYQAGKESRDGGPQLGPASTDNSDHAVQGEGEADAPAGSRALINECVRHICTARLLSNEPIARSEISTLQSLIEVLGLTDQVMMAQARSMGIIDRLAYDMRSVRRAV